MTEFSSDPCEGVMKKETYEKLMDILNGGYSLNVRLVRSTKSYHKFFRSNIEKGGLSFSDRGSMTVCSSIDHLHSMAFPEKKDFVVKIPSGIPPGSVRLEFEE